MKVCFFQFQFDDTSFFLEATLLQVTPDWDWQKIKQKLSKHAEADLLVNMSKNKFFCLSEII